MFNLSRRNSSISKHVKPVDILCHECGNDVLRYDGIYNFRGFAFDGYHCIKCGNQVMLDRNEVFKHGNDIRTISVEPNKRRIHEHSEVLEIKEP